MPLTPSRMSGARSVDPLHRMLTDRSRVLTIALQWIEEATELCPNTPILLVGLRKDLREDPAAIEAMRKKSQKFITAKAGADMANHIGARKYLECSALTGEGVDDVFEAATRAALLMSGKSGRGCCVVQ